MAVYLYLFTCYSLFIYTNEAARILAVFPTPSISHQVVFRPLTLELAKRGHDVTVITTDPIFSEGKAPDNFTEIDVHDISYDIWRKTLVSRPSNDDGILTQMHLISEMFVDIFDAQVQDENVRKLIHDKNQKFDLLILEACFRPALAFSYVYKVPVIQIGSFGFLYDNIRTVGAPFHPLLYPSIPSKRQNNLTLWEKIKETYIYFKTETMYTKFISIEDSLLKKYFGPDIPSVTELSKNVDMLFLNVNPVFGGIRPVPPNVVYIGGIHQIAEKELPADLKAFLDSSENGVIYISFGTNVDPTLLPPDRIQVLVNVFSQLPYNVLWKWNGDELPGRTENIRISKWLPQSDLLRHPKIKVFVTQAGLQSTDEAITAGVPLIAIPMLGDQFFNAERYEYHHIGVQLDINDLTEEIFKNVILNVVNDESYRLNIIKLRGLIRDQVQTPLERAVWWTEYVLRHGGAKHLRSPTANISWAEYLELELLLTLLTGLFAILFVSFTIIKKLYKFVFKHYLIVKVKRS